MLSETEVGMILEDESKRVVGDLGWTAQRDHPMWVSFVADIETDAGFSLFIKGSLNLAARKLSFALIHRGEARRIYGLCLGTAHSDPEHGRLGDKHKHRWTEQYADKSGYVPEEITAPVAEPIQVWEQFCREAKITHHGRLSAAPPSQMELL